MVDTYKLGGNAPVAPAPAVAPGKAARTDASADRFSAAMDETRTRGKKKSARKKLAAKLAYQRRQRAQAAKQKAAPANTATRSPLRIEMTKRPTIGQNPNAAVTNGTASPPSLEQLLMRQPPKRSDERPPPTAPEKPRADPRWADKPGRLQHLLSRDPRAVRARYQPAPDMQPEPIVGIAVQQGRALEVLDPNTDKVTTKLPLIGGDVYGPPGSKTGLQGGVLAWQHNLGQGAAAALALARILNNLPQAEIPLTPAQQGLLRHGSSLRPSIEYPDCEVHQIDHGGQQERILIRNDKGRLLARPITALELVIKDNPQADRTLRKHIRQHGYLIAEWTDATGSQHIGRERFIGLSNGLVKGPHARPYVALSTLIHELEHGSDSRYGETRFLDYPAYEDTRLLNQRNEGKSVFRQFAYAARADPDPNSTVSQENRRALRWIFGNSALREMNYIYRDFNNRRLDYEKTYQYMADYYPKMSVKISGDLNNWLESWKYRLGQKSAQPVGVVNPAAVVETTDSTMPLAPPHMTSNKLAQIRFIHGDNLAYAFMQNWPLDSTEDRFPVGSTAFDVAGSRYSASYKIDPRTGRAISLRITPSSAAGATPSDQLRDFATRAMNRESQALALLSHLRQERFSNLFIFERMRANPGWTPSTPPQNFREQIDALSAYNTSILRDIGFMTPTGELDRTKLKLLVCGNHAFYSGFTENLQAQRDRHHNSHWTLRGLETIEALRKSNGNLNWPRLEADPARQRALLNGEFGRNDGTLDMDRLRHALANPQAYRGMIGRETALELIKVLRRQQRTAPERQTAEERQVLRTCSGLDRATITQVLTDQDAYRAFGRVVRKTRDALELQLCCRRLAREQSRPAPDPAAVGERLLMPVGVSLDGLGLLGGQPVYRRNNQTIALPADMVQQLFKQHGRDLLEAMTGMSGTFKDQSLLTTNTWDRLKTLMNHRANRLPPGYNPAPGSNQTGIVDLVTALRNGALTINALNPAQRFVLAQFFPANADPSRPDPQKLQPLLNPADTTAFQQFQDRIRQLDADAEDAPIQIAPPPPPTAEQIEVARNRQPLSVIDGHGREWSFGDKGVNVLDDPNADLDNLRQLGLPLGTPKGFVHLPNNLVGVATEHGGTERVYVHDGGQWRQVQDPPLPLAHVGRPAPQYGRDDDGLRIVRPEIEGSGLVPRLRMPPGIS
ncbi:MAG: hypothetical protein WED00_13495 [Aquisalimonadaceae bacterium]